MGYRGDMGEGLENHNEDKVMIPKKRGHIRCRILRTVAVQIKQIERKGWNIFKRQDRKLCNLCNCGSQWVCSEDIRS